MTEAAVEAVQPKQSIAYETPMQEIVSLIKGRVPIIWVVTHEENRFLADFLEHVGKEHKRALWTWSAYQGLHKFDDGKLAIEPAGGEEAKTNVAKVALERIVKHKPASNDYKGTCYLLRDFHIVLAEPIPRQIRDIYDNLIKSGKTLIIISPMLAHGSGGTKSGLPPTLEKSISVVHYDLPTSVQIEDRIRMIIGHMKNKQAKSQNTTPTNLDYDDTQFTEFAKALTGLTMTEVENAIATSLTHLKGLDIRKLISEKRQIIRKSEILEFIPSDVEAKDVGGLDQVKEYLTRYASAYTDEAKAFGVEPLKGVLFTGIPGTGKSLLAKAMGNLWKTPLLRLDVGKVMTGLVGGSEGKMREVIAQAEAMAPCILWIDEVEKSLAGTKSSNFSDGGTLARVFGTLLTAMQDGMEGVTIIATANDISLLPPEFIRRFNEVFFVDLPGPNERWEIFGIHLRKRGRNIDSFSSQKSELLTATDGYTGAEIEKAVKDGLAAAFYAGQKDIKVKQLLTALADTKPISKVMGKKIQKIRDLAKGNYRYASSWAEEQSGKHTVKTKSGKKLDVSESLDDLSEIKTSKEKKTSSKAAAKDRFDNLE